MMRRLVGALITFGLLGAGLASPAQATVPAGRAAQVEELDRALQVALDEVGTPGVSAAIVFADGRRWSGAAGLADVETKRRVKESTPFAVASVTKTFVAALALQLAEQGEVDLDEPVGRWLPSLPGGDVITLRQLLSHTSGLSNGPIGARGQRWTPTEVIASMDPPACAPATCFRYADMNYVVAGAVLEAATGGPVAGLARTRFFAPLGMADTWFQGSERARGPTATAYRNGVADSDGGPFVPSTDFVTRTGLSGSLASTVGDLATWGDALFRGDVLQPRSLDEMLDFEATADLPCPLVQQCAPGYGLGMELQHHNAWIVWQHSGSTGALLAHVPRQGLTLAVLTNGSPGIPPGPFPAARALIDALPGLRGHSAVFAIDADGSNRHRVTPRGLRAGVPAVSPDGEQLAFVTEARGARDQSDIAIVDVDGRNDRLLTHDHANNFHPAWSPDGRQIAFASSRDGNPEIYAVGLDGSDPRRLTADPGRDSGPAWSPDGTLIAFSRHVDDRLDIVVMRADGSEPRSVVSMTVHGPFTGEPEWSPDGIRLAFTGDVDGVPNIQIVDVDGSNLTAVTSGHAPSTEVAWAADGTLVFGRLGTLYTVVPGTVAAPRRLEGRADRFDFLPAWSPDSRTIYFTANAR